MTYGLNFAKLQVQLSILRAERKQLTVLDLRSTVVGRNPFGNFVW